MSARGRGRASVGVIGRRRVLRGGEAAFDRPAWRWARCPELSRKCPRAPHLGERVAIRGGHGLPVLVRLALVEALLRRCGGGRRRQRDESFQFRCGRNQAGIKREESVVWRCRDGSRRLRSRHGGRQTRDGCRAANRRLRISAVPLRGGTTAVAHLGTSHRRHGPGAGRKAEQTARQVSRRPRRTAPRAVRRGKVAAAARGLRRLLARTFWAGCDAFVEKRTLLRA